MLPRTAFGLGMAFGLVLAGPGLAVVVGARLSAQQSQQPSPQEQRINRSKALGIEVQRETRDQAERTELIRRLVTDNADEVTALTAKRKMLECQQKRHVSEQGLSRSPADTRRRCTPDIQLWSMRGDERAEPASS